MARTQQKRGNQQKSNSQKGRGQGNQQGGRENPNRGSGNQQRGRQPKFNLDQLANEGLNEGINAFVKAHPRFMGQEKFLTSYIDSKKMNDYLAQSMKDLGGKYGKVDSEKVKDTLAGYVNSGEVFNEKGKEVLLSHSWDKRSRSFWQRGAKEIIAGEKYLDKTMESFRDLYNLLSSGDYAERNKTMASAVSGIYNLGFTDAAVNVLYNNGKLDKTKYTTLKKAIVDRAKKGEETILKEVEKSALAQKVEKVAENIKKPAGVALAGIGTAIVIGTNSITGNVIQRDWSPE